LGAESGRPLGLTTMIFAIGADDNATFMEEDGFYVNEDAGCE
jgi:hypothetical protein